MISDEDAQCERNMLKREVERKSLEEHDKFYFSIARDFWKKEPKSIKAALYGLVDAILEKYDLIEKE